MVLAGLLFASVSCVPIDNPSTIVWGEEKQFCGIELQKIVLSVCNIPTENDPTIGKYIFYFIPFCVLTSYHDSLLPTYPQYLINFLIIPTKNIVNLTNCLNSIPINVVIFDIFYQ